MWSVAIIEACEITEDGRILPDCGWVCTPTIARLADKVIVELNAAWVKPQVGTICMKWNVLRIVVRFLSLRPSGHIGLPCPIQGGPFQVAGISRNQYARMRRVGFQDLNPYDRWKSESLANVKLRLASGHCTRELFLHHTFLPLAESRSGNVLHMQVLECVGPRDPGILLLWNVCEVVQDSVIKLVKKPRSSLVARFTCSLGG